MESRYIETLKDFAHKQSELGTPSVNRRVLLALEAFGRERLSTNFFMRDFLHSEISAVHGIPNIPSDPELAVKAGRGLCTQLLEPLHRTFGQVVVRSAFRSRAVLVHPRPPAVFGNGLLREERRLQSDLA